MDSMEQCRKFYVNMPLISWKVFVDSMENLPSIPREISTEQSITVSNKCSHWLNMTETLIIEILFTFDSHLLRCAYYF